MQNVYFTLKVTKFKSYLRSILFEGIARGGI